MRASRSATAQHPQATQQGQRVTRAGHDGAPPGAPRTARAGLVHNPHARAFAMLLAASVFTTWMAVKSPSRVGSVEDDGVYLVTARALSTGQGYVHLALPGAPKQTKYPILYPAVLAVFWGVFKGLDAVVLCAQLFNAAAALGALWLTYRLFCRARLMPPSLCAGSLLLVAVNPDWWSFCELVMSEHLYTLLASASLLLTVGGLEQTPDARRERDPGEDAAKSVGALAPAWRFLPLGLTLSTAILARSIGISLCAAVLATALIRRRWLGTLCIGLTVGICLLPWLSWQHSAANANSAIPQASAFSYDLAYQSWLPSSFGQLARVVYLNISRLGLGVVGVGLCPAAWLPPSALWGEDSAGVMLTLVLAMFALSLAGCFVAWRSSARSLPLYLASYLGMVLCWPFDPGRFVVPVLPLILPMSALGAYALLRAAGSAFSRLISAPLRQGSDRQQDARAGAAPGSKTVQASAVCVLLPIIALGLAEARFGYVQMLAPGKMRMLAARQRMIDVLQENTPADAVIAAPNANYVYLLTGRNCVPTVPAGSSYELLYAPDATFSQAGRFITEGGDAFQQQMLERELIPYYESAGVTHIVDLSGGGGYAILRRVMDGHAERFPPLSRSDELQLRAFRNP